ncbi:AIPR family protein [Microbacterium foliorum]|uniref:AIPR family protein n=1 Tax=Microbacterium foliorum TaxID=104336 RepID=UPI001E30CA90|nr:AIPR family protein [Microbacterium foliorum]
MQSGDGSERPGFSAFEARDDLVKYGSNALLLFLAQMRLGIDDIEAFATNALTDHSNDKKSDLVAVVNDGSKIVVAQGYFAQNPKPAAPGNKAADANTAVSWLISGELESVPDVLRGAAEEVRAALLAGTVSEFEIWYSHNLPESTNVQRELDQAARTADALIKRDFPQADVDVTAREFGITSLEAEYARTQAPILVADEFTLEVPGGFELSAEGWSAFSTAISAAELRAIWSTHTTDLMSPNIRDYLGMVRSVGNINFGIKETAKSEPENFAIFNNGITILVNDYELDETASKLKVQGVGIVNGGQTTGAIGELSSSEAARLDEAMVMARFVKCTDPTVLQNIVRYNNTQNKVEATDFRSKDPIQERLREEFSTIPEAEYRGGRRGGASDAIVRRRGLLPDSSVAQSLAAFHGRPNLAYNETRTIWDTDAIYASVFRDTVGARHIVFVFGLLRAVDQAKQSIMAIPETGRTDAQKRHAEFFRSRGSNLLLVAAIGACVETILGRPVTDRTQLSFKMNLSPAEATQSWQPLVDTLLAFSKNLAPATDQGLKSQDKVAKALEDFAAMVEATRSANPDPFDALAASTLPATPTEGAP